MNALFFLFFLVIWHWGHCFLSAKLCKFYSKRHLNELSLRTQITNSDTFHYFLGASEVLSISPVVKETDSSSGTVAEAQPTTSPEYAYNRKSQLVVKGYPYSRSGIKGALNTAIEWRCVDGRKLKCNARVRTLGKTLQIINIVHNHEPKKQKQYKAILWNEKDWKLSTFWINPLNTQIFIWFFIYIHSNVERCF